MFSLKIKDAAIINRVSEGAQAYYAIWTSLVQKANSKRQCSHFIFSKPQNSSYKLVIGLLYARWMQDGINLYNGHIREATENSSAGVAERIQIHISGQTSL